MEESFNWIKAAINSCKSEFHLECCKILIGLFIKKYEGEILAVPAYMELMDDYLEKETFLSVEV
jgi:hypothetical protein